MFPGFAQTKLQANGVNIHVRIGGSGPPAMLLLHGYPQSHLIWHRVAPELAKSYTVVLTDLRGYGASDKPAGVADHANYSKRTMAQDQVQVMHQLGFDQFFLCGHDRGGRVAHRLAVDHSQAVKKLMLLDISPTLTMYEQTNRWTFAKSYWWWFWLIQPAPFPESMVAGGTGNLSEEKNRLGTCGSRRHLPMKPIRRTFRTSADPATMHGMCEDYRAAASIDLLHDRADRDAGRKIACPVNVLWGEFGVVNRCFKPLEDWRAVAGDVRGNTLPCGHYIPEEVPTLLLDEMKAFFV